MWRSTVGHRVLDSPSPGALAYPDRIAQLLCHRVVRRSFVRTRYLRADDWLLRSEPNCWIPSGDPNLRRDGLSGCRGLPLSRWVRRCGWGANIRLVVRAEVDVAIAGHERIQRASFNCACAYGCCTIGVPWIQPC